MSDLPMTNKEALSSVSESHYNAADLSNPYMYPSNPSITSNSNVEQNIPSLLNNTHSTLEEKVDPELQKIKSSIWKRAAQIQSTIGSITGLESLQTSGERARRMAEKEYEEAENRLNQGEASRIHGEYDRLMGYVSYAIGHVAGDTEMQSKANQRTLNGTNEIDKSTR
ncbi:hypothetical protein BD770DRAFT_385026 [Pilaira anomala]|nr:hypothetical protein BD770DRAFT_385026 [Pilaira anomala]